MSWTDELYKIYEDNYGRTDVGEVILPVAHSTANAQIEITLSEDGEFVGARALDKSESVTIIPVTEDSGSRSSGIAPMPFADKLVYIAGDYSSYAEGKRSHNSDYYGAYITQLQEWCESENSHSAVKAVYAYLKKSCIMKDLIESGVLKIDDKSGRLSGAKIMGIDQGDAFVRFWVNYKDINRENRTWLDSSLYNSFIEYNNSKMDYRQLCYATGKILPCTYKHPSKVRSSGDKAKLISSNDESGFTYRGRFSCKEEAISVSYDFSQKMHNALKWLIAKQGMNIENSLMLIIWASALQPLPDIRRSFSDCYDEEFPDDDIQTLPDTEAAYKIQLHKMIFGYRSNMEIGTKVMVMGLDAATTGRLSMTMYNELEGSDFLKNIENWHSTTAWLRFNKTSKKNTINSFSVYEIAKCAYGTEQNGEIKCKPEVLKETILRLIPCITEGRKLPTDIMKNLVVKASNPQAYEKSYNHRTVLETACGIVRKSNIDNKKGAIIMAVDENITDRSYLYGRMLAIADKAESDTYNAEERGKRVTNARRYWNSFYLRPYRTWVIIEQRLRPYLDKLGGKAVKYEKLLHQIESRMSIDEYSSAKALEPLYLLGYHCQMNDLYTSKKETENNEEE